MLTYAQVTETETHQFATEASTLGWKPGYWPKSIETDMGNKMPFNLVNFDGEVARYVQTCGCITLSVFND